MGRRWWGNETTTTSNQGATRGPGVEVALFPRGGGRREEGATQRFYIYNMARVPVYIDGYLMILVPNI